MPQDSDAKAQSRARYTLLPIHRADDAGMARVIRTVMLEFGASGPGFAIHDTEVDDMSRAYAHPRCAYFVVVEGDRVVGGGGIAPLAGSTPEVCELRKMYFLPELRGLGFGQELIALCLSAARAFEFKRCYLETLEAMTAARALYERNGFTTLKKPLGATGHFGCDAWYTLAL